MKRPVVLVTLLLAATSCASSSTAKHGPTTTNNSSVTITGTDQFRFTPARVTVHSGDVTLRLAAAGSYPHNVALPQLHQTSATVGTAPGNARSALLQLHDVRPGVYRFLCTFHNKAGMTGELVVE